MNKNLISGEVVFDIIAEIELDTLDMYIVFQIFDSAIQQTNRLVDNLF